MKGYVYILSNPAFPDLLKIGKTIHNPHRRAKTLSKETGVPSPFEVEHSILTYDCSMVEIAAHNYFRDSRPNRKREFFNASLIDIKYYLSQFDIGYQPPVYYDAHVKCLEGIVRAKKANLDKLKRDLIAQISESSHEAIARYLKKCANEGTKPPEYAYAAIESRLSCLKAETKAAERRSMFRSVLCIVAVLVVFGGLAIVEGEKQKDSYSYKYNKQYPTGRTWNGQ